MHLLSFSGVVMNFKYRQQSSLLFFFLFFFSASSFAIPSLKIATIGDFKTANGDTINQAKIGYRTIGVLNKEKNNAVLWPSWFTGTSEDIFTTKIIDKILTKKNLFIVVVDALGNGVSSSPSNSKNFPNITIEDMVNSQYLLLVEHLGINQLRGVVGISMGGMQALQWSVSYPNFMDKIVSIIGTPKQSSIDLLFWKIQADLLSNSSKFNRDSNFSIKRAYDLFYLNLMTPTKFSQVVAPSDIGKYMESKYKKMIDPRDYLAMVNAMMQHNIYKTSQLLDSEINSVIKAKLLIIVSDTDHIVNPINSIALAERLGSEKHILTGINGHMAAFIQTAEILKKTSIFLQ
jgi:homoserine O-acetyltransferase